MLEAPIPDNDQARVATLHGLGLLDTPPDQRFNRITRTAARLFRVPIATITLVDANRQWFKSRFGLFVAETPRNVSFCGHAILSDDMLVIENTLEDERFRDNPLVTGAPHIRFYAGRPLSTPGGVKLGTLCLIDRTPRQFSEEDRLTLEDMAGWAEREVNLSIEFARMNAQLVSVMEHLVSSVMLISPEQRVSWADAGIEQLLGREPGSLNGLELKEVMSDRTLRDIDASTDGKASSFEAQLRQRDGKFINVQSTLVSSTVDGRRYGTLLLKRA